jgi:hypothetical protein
MQCDRAQEFFSDYLEHTLDRPMTVAIESHLAGCVNCREEVEVLQSTFLALDSLPEVEPPADGAWQVMMAIRQQRAAQYEAERRKAPSFLEWLRTLNPMGVAMGASLATLAIGGSLFVTGIPHDKLGFDFVKPTPVVPVVGKSAPQVLVTYGPASGQSQTLEVRFTPSVTLTDGEVRLTGEALSAPQAAKGTIAAGMPVVFNLQMPSNAGAQVLKVTAQGQGTARPYESTIVVPFAARSTEPMTLVLTDQPMVDALRRVASSLGHPIVVDGVVPAAVTLQAADMPAARVLEELAVQAQFTVHDEGGVYRLSPAN